jgi:HPt (histidine-containing phosphotransfer) domain-containing protein
MDGYVTKPIDAPTLFATIRSMLPPDRLAAMEREKCTAPDAEDCAAAQVSEAAAPAPASAAAQVDGGLPPINLQSLKQRCLGNRKIAAKALGTFQNTTLAELSALSQSVRSGDARLAASSAHKIKGAAANVSAEGIRGVAAQIEQLARADAMSQAVACIEQLDREVNRFRDYLSTALAELSAAPPDAPSEGRKHG